VSTAPGASHPSAARVARGPGSPRAGLALAGVCYLVVSVSEFGAGVLAGFRHLLLGTGGDPQIFVWALGWWPHAIGAGINPVVTRALWSPVGSDLVWATAVPGLALPLAPVTLLFGPIAAYNLAALLLPAAAALAAYVLCRHLTRAFWPALLGGYLFGFSSYVAGHELGHLHLTAVFALPLVALGLLRFCEGSLGGRGLMLRVGPLLGLQFALSTEVYFTLFLAIAVALAAAGLVAPASRPALRAVLLPLAGCYAISFALVSPLLYYALTDLHTGAVTPVSAVGADLVSFAFPTGLTAIGGGLAPHFDPSIALVSPENGQYLGLPAILIIALYLWRRRDAPVGRLLAICLGVAFLATLGGELQVRGIRLVPLPWRALQQLPLFDNVIPGRLSVYVALLGALIVALWSSSGGRPTGATVALCALAALAIIPDVSLAQWHEAPEQPAFFASGLARRCLRAGENTLILPAPFRSEALLWQAEDGFRFDIADAGLNADIPAHLPDRQAGVDIVNNNVPPHGAAGVVAFARASGVGAILVDASSGAMWRALLDRALPGRALGGVDLYALSAGPSGCVRP